MIGQLEMLPVELFCAILSYLDLDALVNFAQVNDTVKALISTYAQSRLLFLISTMCPAPSTFFDILHEHDAVVGGSTALRFMYGERNESWMPKALDVFVGLKQAESLKESFRKMGYQDISSASSACNPSTMTQTAAVNYFRGERGSLKLIIGRRDCAISPIFEAIHTVQMNFLTRHSLFCAYPSLTFQRLAFLNPCHVREGQAKEKFGKQINKYQTFGLSVVDCPLMHGRGGPCNIQCRRIDDEFGTWFDVENMSLRHFRRGDLGEGVQMVAWKLGGSGCDPKKQMIIPYIRESYSNSCDSKGVHLGDCPRINVVRLRDSGVI